jgi:uridine kinase
VFIGIGGGTASGKSTLALAITAQLAPLTVQTIGQDRFFKSASQLPPFESASRAAPWPDYNRPDSFQVDDMLDTCRAQRGMEVVILEGILVLHYPVLRELMDLLLYVDADADERIVRRICRNVEAGMALSDVADYYLESVRYQHQRYNIPTRQHADLVIPGGNADHIAREALLRSVCAAITSVVPS